MADQQTTEYVVLRSTGQGAWVVAHSLSARDANTAIRETFAKLDSSRGASVAPAPAEFVAVPFRSWNRVTVTPKVETTLVLEDAS